MERPHINVQDGREFQDLLDAWMPTAQGVDIVTAEGLSWSIHRLALVNNQDAGKWVHFGSWGLDNWCALWV